MQCITEVVTGIASDVVPFIHASGAAGIATRNCILSRQSACAVRNLPVQHGADVIQGFQAKCLFVRKTTLGGADNPTIAITAVRRLNEIILRNATTTIMYMVIADNYWTLAGKPV
jgi:hypothetical protein